MSNLGIRIQQARKAAGLSLRALGDLVGLSHAAIKKYEDDKVYPSSDVLLKLADALHVKIDFFFRPIKVTLDNLKFRKRKNLTKKSETAIKFEVFNQIEKRLELENLYPENLLKSFEIPENFPEKINTIDEVELLAESLRRHLKLGLSPIYNLIDAFENRGIRVFVSDLDDEHFDGFSTIINEEPIIVISSKKSGDRQRFNLAHELAHFLLADRLSSGLDEEKACNRFSGSFLLPRDIIFEEIGRVRKNVGLQELMLVKDKYQISMSAICYRLKDLKVINEHVYKHLMIQFCKKGWNKKEPGAEISPETTHIFKQMIFHALAENYIGESKAAELLSCTISELKALHNGQQSHSINHKRC